MPSINKLTAGDSFDSRIQGFRLGADDFVGKGMVINELEVRILRALERSNAIDDAFNGARKAISWAREALDEALQADPEQEAIMNGE